jgi:hypothetical protein
MHTLLTWSVRLILLFILTAGLVLVFFMLKDTLKEMKNAR